MANLHNKIISISTAKLSTMVPVRQGWYDKIFDEPFPKEYDSWNKVDQANYERGRLWAISFMTAGLALPRWKANQKCPKEIKENLFRACFTNGQQSIPRGR